MCGFTFIINHKNQNFKKKNKIFLKALQNRGNDSFGEYHDEDISFFFQRLSIIDHEKGNQPLTDKSGRYIICFSGEIYNYIELRKELEDQGSIFQTNSDTETILEGFKKKGEQIIKDLNGMFSFVIWDKKEKKAFIGKDRLGKKPLYWIKNNELTCFSNTLKSFEIFGLINKKNINLDSLYNFLIFNIDIKSKNFYYENVHKFPRGRFLNIKKNSPEKLIFNKYWQINFQKKKRKFSDFLDEYEHLITDSIKIRLRSDTNKAIAISGGVDSATIANIVVKKFNAKVNFINIDHEIYREDTDANDDPDKIVDFLKQKVKKIRLSNNEFIKYLNYSLNVTETPHNLYNTGIFHKLCEIAGKESKILLTGNGADEIFFGYNGDEKHMLLNKLSYLPIKMVPGFKKNVFKIFLNYSKNKFLKKILIKKNIQIDNEPCEFLEDDFNNSNFEDLLDLKLYLSLFVKSENNNFINPDIIGLKNNIEVRSPFLDHRMVNFAASLPHKYKINKYFDNTGNKFLPKEYLKKIMPTNIIEKKKRGFGWNFDMNKLIHQEIFDNNDFDSFSQFNLDKEYFKNIAIEFQKQIQKKIHPNTIVSRFFYNSIMLNKWIKKH